LQNLILLLLVLVNAIDKFSVRGSWLNCAIIC